MAGWAGIVFIVLNVVAFVMYGTPPSLDAPAAEIAEYLADVGDTYMAGIAIALVAGIFASVFFAGLLIPYFRSDREHAEGYGTLLLIGAVFWGLLAEVGLVVSDILPYRGGAELDAATYRVFTDFGFLAYAASGLAFVVVGLAAALAVRKRALMPAWFGYLSWLAVVAGLLSALAVASESSLVMVFPGYALEMIWVLSASILLAREKSA